MRLAVLGVIGISLFGAQAFAATASVADKAAVAPPASAVAGQLQAPKDRLSYAVGVDFGNGFKRQNIDVNPSIVAQAMQDVLSGNRLLMTEQDVRSTITDFRKQIMAKQEAEFKQMGQKNLDEGTAFLVANKTKPGVVTTASGLQYKVIEEGKGASPTDKDMVTVDYQGSFIDGKVFDSSYQRGKSVTFGVTDVIPGWTQALKMMKQGATWEVYVPANLAYGSNGMPPVIGPNQALVFKIHLIGVAKKQ